MQRELLSLWEASWIPIVKKEEDLRLKKWETNLLYIGVDPVASCKLGKKSLNSFYKGHGSVSQKRESAVLKKVCPQKSRAPFFLIYI